MLENIGDLKESSESRGRETEVLSDSDNEGTEGYKKGMLEFVPDRRATAAEMLRHPWLQSAAESAPPITEHANGAHSQNHAKDRKRDRSSSPGGHGVPKRFKAAQGLQAFQSRATTCRSSLARMGSCKSQRSSHALDGATGSPSMEECLPQHMLEAILGELDRETLCTARLVSRTFCAAASANISSLTLYRPSQAVLLERFSRLGQVTVHHFARDYSLAELDPRLRAVITHLTVSQGNSLGRMPFLEVLGMPTLQELHVDAHCLWDGAEVLHSLTNLGVLRIGGCTPSTAMSITTITRLTSLAIGLVKRPGQGWRSADFSWLHLATNLRQLRDLHIAVLPEAWPLIGNLTGLTGLTCWGDDMQDTACIAPLSCLSRLKFLEIALSISQSDLAILCSLGSLANLSLRATWQKRASADCWRLLGRQTALRQLTIATEDACNLRHMGALRMELLQCLDLKSLKDVDAEGLDVLQRATRLTKLVIDTGMKRPGARLSQTLGRLTRLLCLQLNFYGYKANTTNLNLGLALSPLTALTELRIYSVRFCNGDWRALLAITTLQVLYLFNCRVRDDMVPELAVLTSLRELSLVACGVTSLKPATGILNPLREARGWPPVDACCSRN